MKRIVVFILILLLAAVGLHLCDAYGDNTGATHCSGTANSSASEDPWLDDDWENGVGNGCNDNATTTEITSNTFDSGDQSYVLYLKDYGFSLSGTIVGVVVTVNIWHSTSGGVIDLCQLLDETGARGGTNLCAAGVTIGSSSDTTVITLGDATNLWGRSLTDTWTNDADFGVALGILQDGNNADVYIDYVAIDVYYTPGTSRQRMILMGRKEQEDEEGNDFGDGPVTLLRWSSDGRHNADEQYRSANY